MKTLPIQRYQFNCQTQAPLALNNYSGSLLRGAFGHALRALSCVTKMSDCTQCMLYRQCNYPAIFEPPAPIKSAFQAFNHIPSPYIIEPPEMGQKQLLKNQHFSFNMVLIGHSAIAQLPLIILAWKKALQHGLGAQKTPVKLNHIRFEPQQTVEHIIYQTETDKLTLPTEFIPQTLSSVEKINIQLLSPLRIQQQNKILSHNMLGKDFLKALVRRYYLLQEFYLPDYQAPDFSALDKQAEQVQGKTDFKEYKWTRYSSRQKQKIVLTGVVGTLELTGDLSPFLILLTLGQWMHVGKNTTFGMGQYELTVDP